MQDDRTEPDHGRRLVGLAVGLSIVLAAVAIALGFALSGDDDDGQTIPEVAGLHLLEPTDPPPPRARARRGDGAPPRRSPGPPPGDGGTPRLPPPDLPPLPAQRPPASSEPDGTTGRILEAGWRPIGARSDTIDGLAVETLIYARRGQRLGHSLILGDPDPPEPVRRLGRSGTLLRSFEDGPLTVVTWSSDGVAEVLAGAGLSRRDLYDLATGPA